jgi:hypothetical protein
MSDTEQTEVTMTWRERLVCRILLIIASMVAPGGISKDIEHLANHIAQAKP